MPGPRQPKPPGSRGGSVFRSPEANQRLKAAFAAQQAGAMHGKAISTSLSAHRKPTRGVAPGTVVRFTYRHHKDALSSNEPLTNRKLRKGLKPGDDHKEVLVLNPSYKGKMHGIDLKRLTAAEREVLRSVFDPEVIATVRQGRPHRLPLVNDILRRMDPVAEAAQPSVFYQKFVKPFIKNKDVYRTYWAVRIWRLSVVKDSPVGPPPTDLSSALRNISKKADRDAVVAATEKPEPQPDSSYLRAMQNKGKLSGAVKPEPRQNRLDLIRNRARNLARQTDLVKPSKGIIRRPAKPR